MNISIEQQLKVILSKSLDEASKEEIYIALLNFTKKQLQQMERNSGDRKLYYISAEFLVGKLLSNNLINLGIFEEVRDVLKNHGHNLTEIEEMEMEPSLGNGGLGRLAACFLDSIATLGLHGDGVGLNYHDGLFMQKFKDNKQREEKNPWITDESWLTRTDVSFEVPFKDFTLKSTMYDIDVPGYNSGCNKLHLFDLDSVDESIIHDGIQFDKNDIKKNLTLFLYPDDSDEAGKLLRLYQQYFMVSNAAQLIIKEAEDRGVDLYHLHEHVCIQINDTHPTMVIPELIRILTEEKNFNIDTAVDVVSKSCAYTNHTILAEALEKWPISYLEKVVPQLMPIIRDLDRRVRRDFHDERVYIIDNMDRVHMAHIDIHFGYAVNGVAAVTLGTEDGANVEIHQLVGDDNIYIFGEKSEKIIKLYETGEYCAADIYDNDPMVEELVDFIISKDLMRIGDPVNLGRLYKEIVEKDWFMALLDVKDYIQTKEQMLKDYEDKNAWAKKMLMNIAKAGFFSSDRTIAEYNQDIWHL